MNFRKDIFWLGFMPGLIIPFVLFFLIYYAKYQSIELMVYVKNIIRHDLLGKIISLGAVPNLLMFFIFIWLNKNHAARGVLAATFVIAFMVLIFKFMV